MPATDDLQTLADFGLFNENSLAKLANLIRNIQALSSNGAAPSGRRGRPAGGGGGKRGPRAKFTAGKAELATMKKSGMTAKAIADKLGVSMATVNLHLKKHGLTTPRGAKKK